MELPELSENQKRILVKAITGAIIVALGKLTGDYGILGGALLAGALAFFTKVDQSVPGKKAPGALGNSWLKHIGV